MFFCTPLLIVEKWNKSILSVYPKVLEFLQSQLPSTISIFTICYNIRAFLYQRYSEVGTLALNVTVWEASWDCRQTTAGSNNPITICLFNFNNKNTRILSEISSKVTIKVPEWHHCIVLVLLSYLLTLNRFHTLFSCFYCCL